MLLSDRDIRKLVESHNMLEPFSEAVSGNGVISWGLSHAGYDLRLGGTILIFKNTYGQVISPLLFKDGKYTEQLFDRLTDLHYGRTVQVPPHSYILANSLEYIRIPRHIKGRCVGKSTLARCGLIINTTPLEPGWHGHLTIEIANASPCPVVLPIGQGIAQLEFEALSSMPDTDYESKKGKYQAQGPEPVPARVL